MVYLKVLVVHRQEAMLDEMKSILDKFGPYMRLYHCGIDGLQAGRIETFDLILCGIDLPLITGFEMVRGLRNFSKNRKTPTIFIVKQMEAGFEDLCKQLNVQILEQAHLQEELPFLLRGICKSIDV